MGKEPRPLGQRPLAAAAPESCSCILAGPSVAQLMQHSEVGEASHREEGSGWVTCVLAPWGPSLGGDGCSQVSLGGEWQPANLWTLGKDNTFLKRTPRLPLSPEAVGKGSMLVPLLCLTAQLGI